MKQLDDQSLRVLGRFGCRLSNQGWRMTPVLEGKLYEVWPDRYSQELAAQQGCMFGLLLDSSIAEWEIVCRGARPDAYVQYLTGLRALLEDVVNGAKTL